MTTSIPYSLEQLFVDQDHDWVIDTIAPLLAWVPGTSPKRSNPPFRFAVTRSPGTPAADTIDLSWDLRALAVHKPDVGAHTKRLRSGSTVQREHVTELAAYGLTLVAISVLMPGRRVKAMRRGSAPDFLFDLTPGALTGVESAGRATGGQAALRVVRDGKPAQRKAPATVGKHAQLLARTDIAEVHLSLWCASPRTSIMEQVKP